MLKKPLKKATLLYGGEAALKKCITLRKINVPEFFFLPPKISHLIRKAGETIDRHFELKLRLLKRCLILDAVETVWKHGNGASRSLSKKF